MRISSLIATSLVITAWLQEPVLAADSPSSQSSATSAFVSDEAERLVGITENQREQLAMENRSRPRGRAYPPPSLNVVDVSGINRGYLRLSQRPSLDSKIGDRYASITPDNQVVFYTVDPDLQAYVSHIVSQARANHAAVVVMNPKTGAILAIAGKSSTVRDIEYHSGFPAASLFKVVTAAAAVEEAGISANSMVSFRGGTYTLNQSNYYPNPRADRRIMSVGEAMGRSCNPVFGSLGVKYLNGSILSRYAERFGFNQPIGFDAPLPESRASIPYDSAYELSRTAAGFGAVYISPIHAASLVSGIANGGLLPRPQIIDRITTTDGVLIDKPQPEIVQRIVQPDTAQSILEMMRYTTTMGTSRREFMRGSQPTLGNLDVAAKTGTLSGSNPKGLNNWFIAAAPIHDPELAVAVITVDAQRASKASHLGRLVFQKYFNIAPVPEPAPRHPRASKLSTSKRSYKAYQPKKKKASVSYVKKTGKHSGTKKGSVKHKSNAS